jgi:hypothetical protein
VVAEARAAGRKALEAVKFDNELAKLKAQGKVVGSPEAQQLYDQSIKALKDKQAVERNPDEVSRLEEAQIRIWESQTRAKEADWKAAKKEFRERGGPDPGDFEPVPHPFAAAPEETPEPTAAPTVQERALPPVTEDNTAKARKVLANADDPKMKPYLDSAKRYLAQLEEKK